MPFVVLSIIAQALTILHILRTGRDMRWIFLIVFLPGAGILIYLVVEVLPSLNQSLTARRAGRRLRQRIDPERGVRQAALEHERNASVDTASRLADELTAAGRAEEAIAICAKAREGIFADDPKLLLALAHAEFAAERYREVIATLGRLREQNPGFRSPQGHLLQARALEASGETDRALAEYAAVVRYFPGAEAKVREALLHKKLGMHARAAELFAAIERDARLAPKHFRKSEQQWLDLAAREGAELGKERSPSA